MPFALGAENNFYTTSHHAKISFERTSTRRKRSRVVLIPLQPSRSSTVAASTRTGIDSCKQRRYGRHDEDKEMERKKGQEVDRTAFKRRHHATSTSSEGQSRLRSSKPSASASTNTSRKQDNEGSPRLTASTRWDYTCFLNTPLSPPWRRQSVGKRDIP